MVGPIMLLAFACLMAVVSIVLIIVGFVKKNQGLWIGSLVGFVVFCLLVVYAAVNLANSAFDYANSDEFHEKTRKSAESWGKNVGNTITGASQGLEASLDEESISKLAHKGARITGSGVKAMAQGFDETVGKTTVFLEENAEAEGIKIGRAEEKWEGDKLTMILYLEFHKDYAGKVKLISYDSDGTKMDVSELEVKETNGSEKVFQFPFQFSSPGLSGYCVLSKGA